MVTNKLNKLHFDISVVAGVGYTYTYIHNEKRC